MIPPHAAPRAGASGTTVVGEQPKLSRVARMVPPATILLASALSAMPVVADAPVTPPLGLLMMLGWRLLRPEYWRAWMALPLGLADDLLAGQPVGIGMASWTVTLLMLDMIDDWVMLRGYALDWLVAAVAIALCMIAANVAVGASDPGLPAILPQVAIAMLAFPLAERACAALDRWRLRR